MGGWEGRWQGGGGGGGGGREYVGMGGLSRLQNMATLCENRSFEEWAFMTVANLCNWAGD